MSDTCGCCAGITKLTPVTTVNRPGLSALSYRVGTHGSFLQTMKARLSSLQLSPDDFDATASVLAEQLRPLLALTTRESSDPAMAMLDAWALVGDVLTFYQERIANEGFLRTATERRSILELARLIGYRLRAGVASSVYLAFTLEKNSTVVIPKGTRAQSIPGPEEKPQSFETSTGVEARTEWNVFTPRTTRPQEFGDSPLQPLDELYFEGTTTKLKPNDPLLIVFSEQMQVVRRVLAVEPDTAANRTRVRLVPETKFVAPDKNVAVLLQEFAARNKAAGSKRRSRTAKEVSAHLDRLEVPGTNVIDVIEDLDRMHKASVASGNAKNARWIEGITVELKDIVTPKWEFAPAAPPRIDDDERATRSLLQALEQEPSMPPVNAFRLDRNVKTAFGSNADGGTKLLTVLRPGLSGSLYQALASVETVRQSPVRAYALRVTAPLFGYQASPTRPPEVGDAPRTRAATDDQWHVVEPIYDDNLVTINSFIAHEEPNIVHLDASYDSILPGSWIVVDTEETAFTSKGFTIAKAGAVRAPAGRGKYGISGKTTDIALVSPEDGENVSWLTKPLVLPPGPATGTFKLIPDDFKVIRSTTVYAQSELLTLADKPIDPIAYPIEKNRIELADLVSGLESGRWLLITGERIDIPGVTGVYATELAMLAGVEQGPEPLVEGERLHSTLVLANDLAYSYRLDTVTIYGNVAHATHGEKHIEAIGSGDAAKAMQELALRQSPLTYLSAATPAGAESTLEIRVNDILWHETDTLLGAGPTDRRYITSTDDDDKTTVIFGDGKAGSRLPTGRENVKATYRTGIGAPGNVDAGQISILATRPLGVQKVINPLAATGGANREDRDTARRNAPMAVMALDRLVSPQDYEDFARTYAGIGKASATLLSDGRRQVVHLTIAGADDIPISTTSDLYLNLRAALQKYGDPSQGLQVVVRKLKLLVVSAFVKLEEDYLWEAVEPRIRAALLDAFGFARRELAQDALSSEALSVLQAQTGVAYADLEIFHTVNEDATPDELAALGTTAGLHHRISALKARPGGRPRRIWTILPAELVYLSSAVPDTLILTELSQ